jgi:hypothetical protein
MGGERERSLDVYPVLRVEQFTFLCMTTEENRSIVVAAEEKLMNLCSETNQTGGREGH